MAAYNDPYYRTDKAQPYPDTYREQPEFDPYNTQPARQPYEPASYTDDDYPSQTEGLRARQTMGKEDRYEDASYPPAGTGLSKPEGNIFAWRADHRGNMWTRGSRGRCIFRFCCCSIFIVLFLIISIFLTLAVYIRPPNVGVNNVGFPANGSAVQATSNSLNLNLGIDITVTNPNFFNVAFNNVKATLKYPLKGNTTNVGGGQINNLVFHSHTTTTFTFPLQLTYNLADDPSLSILTDLVTKCGILGGQKSNIVVDYDITVGVKFLFINIPPSFSDSLSFECPIQESDIASLLKGSGLNIPGLGSLLS